MCCLLSVMINNTKSAHAISITDTAPYDYTDTQNFQFEDNDEALNRNMELTCCRAVITCNTNNNKLNNNSLQPPWNNRLWKLLLWVITQTYRIEAQNITQSKGLHAQKNYNLRICECEHRRHWKMTGAERTVESSYYEFWKLPAVFYIV